MVAERIKLTMTAASARRKREGKPQAAQQEDPELRAGYGDLVAGKKDIQGSGGEGPGLRQQQRSRRGCEVSKVRLRGARIAGAGSKALPALERPRITGGFSDDMGRGRGSSAGAYGCPVRSVTAQSAQMRLHKDGGCGRGEGAVAAEGTKQPVRRSCGARAWMTGKVSHHEAQCAAKRSEVAERRPRPPNRCASWAVRRL